MSRPAPRKPGQTDPMSDVFAASYAEGRSVYHVAQRHGVGPERVSRALKARKGFEFRTIRPHVAERMAEVAAQAQSILDEARAQRINPAPRLAAGTSAAIHALRAHARIAGPAPADDARIAAAHAAGLTLDDIHEVFAVPPAEAARAIAAHTEC